MRARGAKLWGFDVRVFDKRKTMSFGAYPAIGLVDARNLLTATHAHLAAGRDPIAEAERKRLEAQRLTANTFDAVARRDCHIDCDTPRGCHEGG